jgi:hypothetical protein
MEIGAPATDRSSIVPLADSTLFDTFPTIELQPK